MTAARTLGATATVYARADRWTALPGMVVDVDETGPVEGRWLVTSIRKPDLFDAAVEIEIAKPLPKRLEPAPEIETRTRTIAVPGGNAGIGQRPDGSDSREWGNPLRTMSPITGWFGENRGDHMHAGLDIAQPSGTPILAARAGTVSLAGSNGGYGLCVVIDHGGPNRTSTLYGHMSSMRARVGQKVNRGDWIGNIGSTGNSTGPHLHFEVRFGGTAVDPRPYLP